MIAAWMTTATVFACFLGVAAVAAERALRTLGRQARAPWVAAMCAAVVWTAIAPLALTLVPAAARSDTPVILPAVSATIGTLSAPLPPLPPTWITRVDAILVSLWVIASVALLVRLALAVRALSNVERAATREVIAGVPVFVTPALGPAVFVVRHPRLLVPRWLLDLDAPLRALVVHHEQEHCRARDPQLTLAVAVAIALVPWNPGVWWIARRLRLAMEVDCDARVLRVTGDAERYGRLLLFIAQRQSRTSVATMLAESNSDLSRRILEMNAPRPTTPHARVTLLALVAAAALACSTRYGTNLATTPSEGRAVAGSSQGGVPTYFSPEGATPARPLGGTRAPRYPSTLRSARIEGEVVAQFVVDSSGLVLPGSFKVLRSTDSLFTEAVRATVPTMRFVAPRFEGRNVRQLVQQSFFFDVQGSPASAARRPTPPARPTTDPANRNPMPLEPIIVTVP